MEEKKAQTCGLSGPTCLDIKKKTTQPACSDPTLFFYLLKADELAIYRFFKNRIANNVLSLIADDAFCNFW
jgi:hypothetical protein